MTVTHNSERELEALLASVDRHLPGVRVIVVDNGSSDRSVEVARGRRSVTAVSLDAQPGLRRRRATAAWRRSRARAVAFVNPDVELLDDSLLELASEALRADRPERLLAPRVLNGDLSDQDSVHPRPASAADLVRALVAAGARPAGARRRAMAVAVGRSAPGRLGGRLRARRADRDVARGWGRSTRRSSCMARTSSSGCARRDEGVETWFWPAARVVHHGAHAARSRSSRASRSSGSRAPATRSSSGGSGAGGRRSTIAPQAVTFALAAGGQTRARASRPSANASNCARCGRCGPSGSARVSRARACCSAAAVAVAVVLIGIAALMSARGTPPVQPPEATSTSTPSRSQTFTDARPDGRDQRPPAPAGPGRRAVRRQRQLPLQRQRFHRPPGRYAARGAAAHRRHDRAQ